MRPRASVLIVNHNTRELLRDCMASLEAVAFDSFEVIVVDNGSTDGSAAMLRETFPWARVIEADENLGFVGGNMLGYAQARGEYICFLNSDTRVESGFLSTLVRFMDETPGAGGCEPKLLWMCDPARLDSVGDWLTWTGVLYHRGYQAPDEGFDEPAEIFAAKGACMLFRASLLERIGVFDEAYWSYFEETDLCWRTWLSGHRVFMVPAARVHHLLAGTSRQSDSYLISFHSFKNRIHSMVKNFGGLTLARVLPVHLAICVALIGLYFARGQRRKARAIAAALAWNLRNLRGTLRQRREVQTNIRTVPERELMKVAMASVPLRYFWDVYRAYERV